MRKMLTFALVLSGCANIGTMYTNCDAEGRKFAEVSACTKAAMRQKSDIPDPQRYAARTVAALDLLEERLAQGEITEKQARYQFEEFLARLKAQHDAEFDAIASGNPAFSGGGQSTRTRMVCNPGANGSSVCTSR